MPEVAGIGLAAAFVAGLVSFASPCVLPLVPGYVSFLAGRSVDQLVADETWHHRLAVMVPAMFFVLGFSAVFVALGASASAIGSLFRAYRYEATYVAGAIIVLFGLHMMGLLKLSWLNRDWRLAAPGPGGRPAGALILGMTFAFGWTPCIGPILGAILAISATTLGVADGMVLLAVYAAGLAIPFLLVAAFTGRLAGTMVRMRRAGRALRMIAGGLLIAVGVAMPTGYLTATSTWLLQTFPVLQEIVL